MPRLADSTHHLHHQSLRTTHAPWRAAEERAKESLEAQQQPVDRQFRGQRVVDEVRLLMLGLQAHTNAVESTGAGVQQGFSTRLKRAAGRNRTASLSFCCSDVEDAGCAWCCTIVGSSARPAIMLQRSRIETDRGRPDPKELCKRSPPTSSALSRPPAACWPIAAANTSRFCEQHGNVSGTALQITSREPLLSPALR